MVIFFMTRSNLTLIEELKQEIKDKKYAKEILKKLQLDEYRMMNNPMNQKAKFIKEDGVGEVELILEA
ncbi:hypothetical protein CR513_21325, partial [Mucuna pruriens]